MWADARRRIEALTPTSDRGRWFAVFVPTLVLYLVTANYGPTVHLDVVSALVPAWHLAHHGNLWLESGSLRVPFFVHAGGHLVSNRTPGVILAAVPFYLVFRGGEIVPSTWPGGVASATIAAASIATLFLVFSRLVSRRVALWGAVVAGVATSSWSVSAHELWTHTPNQLWLALGMLWLAAGREIASGWAFALAIITRPHLAVASAAGGIGRAWQTRRWTALFKIGIPAACGLGFYLAWNTFFFRHASFDGGYGAYPTTNLMQSPFSGLGIYTQNVLGTILSAPRGLLPLSPFLLLLIPGLRAGWRAAPTWVKSAAVGGLLYMLVQWRIQQQIDGFVGGYRFYAYRLPIEWLLLSSPLLLLAYQQWTAQRSWRLRAFRGLVALSIGIHAIGAFLYDPARENQFSSWLTWTPLTTLLEHGALVTAVATALVCIAVVLAAFPPRRHLPWRMPVEPLDSPKAEVRSAV